MAPSFAWCAVPVAFAVLRVLPFGWAVGVVVAMVGLLTLAWQRISADVDPVQVAGPIGVALLTVLAYRALDLESRARQDLLDRLVDAQQELAEEQRRTVPCQRPWNGWPCWRPPVRRSRSVSMVIRCRSLRRSLRRWSGPPAEPSPTRMSTPRPAASCSP